MLTTRHPVDFTYTRPELEALFRYAHEHDVERSGHYDARSAAINLWSHHWANEAIRAESDVIRTFYFSWDPTMLREIETNEGFSLEDLMGELEHLELQAFGRVKHGHVPPRPFGEG
jgi:hypothetical protein